MENLKAETQTGRMRNAVLRAKGPLITTALLSFSLAASWETLKGWGFAALALSIVYNGLLLWDAVLGNEKDDT